MKLADISKLEQKKYRQRFGCFVVEGEHLVLELQKAAQHTPALLQSVLYVTDTYQHWASPFPTQLLDARQFARIAGTETPQGILAVVPLLPLQAAAPVPGRLETAIYLHEVQDPGNLGTILRTLAWFGGFRLLLGPGSVDPYNPKVVRASMGALFQVPMELEVTLAALEQRYQRFATLDLQGHSIRTPVFSDFDCYLFGNEARGLPPALGPQSTAMRFSIPGAGSLESLNLATAVSICAFALSDRTA